MSPLNTRNIAAVIVGMAGAGITTHLLGTFLRLQVVAKSVITTLASGVVTVLVLYLVTRGADDN